jgi:hypothetical protein
LGAAVALAGLCGCAASKSPTGAAIGDGRVGGEQARLAPQAARGRGLLIAGDGFGRMAYSTHAARAVVSADDE